MNVTHEQIYSGYEYANWDSARNFTTPSLLLDAIIWDFKSSFQDKEFTLQLLHDKIPTMRFPLSNVETVWSLKNKNKKRISVFPFVFVTKYNTILHYWTITCWLRRVTPSWRTMWGPWSWIGTPAPGRWDGQCHWDSGGKVPVQLHTPALLQLRLELVSTFTPKWTDIFHFHMSCFNYHWIRNLMETLIYYSITFT